jgi:hypothetical protein
MIAANDLALQNRPEALNRVRVNCAHHMLFVGMRHGAMREVARHVRVSAMIICREKRYLVRNDRMNELLHRGPVATLKDAANHFAFALYCTNHDGIALAIPLLVETALVLTADLRLIDFDNAEKLAKLFSAVRCQVQHNLPWRVAGRRRPLLSRARRDRR